MSGITYLKKCDDNLLLLKQCSIIVIVVQSKLHPEKVIIKEFYDSKFYIMSIYDYMIPGFISNLLNLRIIFFNLIKKSIISIRKI